MSWGTCYSGSNNIHFDFPPIMMDGRNYSNWQPGSVINENIRQEAGIKSNAEYRSYLINHADKIIKYNQIQACDQCCPCPASYSVPQNNSSNVPYLYKSCTDASVPFGYETSDLKTQYLSRQELENRLRVPLLSQEQIMKMGYPNVN